MQLSIVSAQTNVSSCAIISAPGEYLLNQSIINSSVANCINITSSDVIFDGAGYTIDGINAKNSYGVYVYNSTVFLSNVTIKNLKVTDWYFGIYYNNAINGSISNSTANSNHINGIYLNSSHNNTLDNNSANTNNLSGINLSFSNSNILTYNTANSNHINGIHLNSISNTTLTNSNITNNSYNFILDGSRDSHFDNNIGFNNTVNGKPIFYIKNAINTTYNNQTNAGVFYCIWCNNVTIKDLTLRKNGYGVFLWNTNNTKIENINVSSNYYGIYIQSSRNNTFSDNTASNNAIWDFSSYSYSLNNIIKNFTILNSTISFTGKDVAIRSDSPPANDPNGYRNIGKYINTINNSADSWLFLKVSYSDNDISGLNESTLKVWKYNGSWSIVGGTNGVETDKNYVFTNITKFSIFAPMIESSQIPTPTPTRNGGNGGSKGGGGGGASAGEDFYNILLTEIDILNFYKDKTSTYTFTDKINPILFISIKSNITSGKIPSKVEVLRNTSTLVDSPAPGIVYKNINIWVGKYDFAIPKHIKEAVIRFKVKNSWIESNNLDPWDIVMVRWDGSKWLVLETTEIEKDSTHTYFETKTYCFSHLAISGIQKAQLLTSHEILDNLIKTLHEGWLLFNPPKEMVIFKKERIEARISKKFIMEKYLFSWDEVPGDNNDKLIDFLDEKYSVEFAKGVKIEKINEGRKIKISDGKNSSLICLNKDKNKAVLEIDNNKTYNFTVKMENGKLNIYTEDTEYLMTGLKGGGKPEIARIKINTKMKARLIGEKFDIIPLSQEEQMVGEEEFAQWEWDVIPKDIGTHNLSLRVSLRLEDSNKDLPLYEWPVKVKVGGWWERLKFIYVKIEAINTFLTLISIVITVLTLWFALKINLKIILIKHVKKIFEKSKTNVSYFSYVWGKILERFHRYR